MNTRRRIWLRRLQAALSGVVLGSIITVLIRLWGQIQLVAWQTNPGFILLATFVVVAVMLGWAYVWGRLLRILGKTNLPTRDLISIYVYGNAAKYIPGSVWSYFARAYLGKQAGMGVQPIWIANGMEFIGSIIVGLVLYAVSLLWPHTHAQVVPTQWLLGIIVVLSLLISPGSLQWIDRLFRRRQPDPERPALLLPVPYYFGYLLATALTWVLIGAAFFLLIQGVYPTEPGFLPEAVGIWSLAVAVGMAAVGFPQGIGVKEGILVVALSGILPLPAALSISLLSRVWIVCSDLLVLFFWWVGQKVYSQLAHE